MTSGSRTAEVGDWAGGLLVWLLALLAGVVAVRVLLAGCREVLASAVLARTNYRGHLLPTAGGLLVVLAVVGVAGVRAFASALGLGDRPGQGPAQALVIVACLGFGLLGLADDMVGTADERGFRGHLRAMRSGRLTTGSLKILGGAAVAVVIVATARPVGGGELLADAVLVALAANVANLFDRAPGRVVKVSVLAYLPLALMAGSGPVGLALAPVMGAAVGLLPDDLGERLMLGDTGANVLGAVLAVGLVLEAGTVVRLVVLAVLLSANLASEVVSFSAVIARTPGLRQLDLLGRRPVT